MDAKLVSSRISMESTAGTELGQTELINALLSITINNLFITMT